MATFTPTTPVAKTIVTTTTDNAHTCKLSKLEFLYDPSDGSLIGVRGVIENYDSGGARIVNTDTSFDIRDGATTPVANKLAEVTNGTDSKGMSIEKAIMELLQSENNPETGSPYLPSGTIS